MSKKFTGVGVSAGRVIGHVRRMPEPILPPADGAPLPQGTSAEEESQRLAEASKAVATGLKERAALATGDAQAVLKATALMASDRTLIKSATKLVTGGTCAESAIWEAADAVATQLAALGGYMAERAGDVLDVRARIVAELRGVPAPGIPDSDQPFILAAVDLAPADTATLDTGEGPGAGHLRWRAAVAHRDHRPLAGPARYRGCAGNHRTGQRRLCFC